MNNVGEQRRPGLPDSHLSALGFEGVPAVCDVNRREHAGRDEGLSSKKERRESEREPDPEANGRDAAMGDKDGRSGRREIHREQPNDEKEHADSVYPERRRVRSLRPAAAMSPATKDAKP